MPPDKPIIRNQDGQELASYEIGPYEIDEDLMIDCEVIGGKNDQQVSLRVHICLWDEDPVVILF